MQLLQLHCCFEIFSYVAYIVRFISYLGILYHTKRYALRKCASPVKFKDKCMDLQQQSEHVRVKFSVRFLQFYGPYMFALLSNALSKETDCLILIINRKECGNSSVCRYEVTQIRMIFARCLRYKKTKPKSCVAR